MGNIRIEANWGQTIITIVLGKKESNETTALFEALRLIQMELIKRGHKDH